MLQYCFISALLDGLLSGVHNEHFMKFSIPNQLENLTSQDSDVINVDILTNHMELSSHSDNGSDSGSIVNCYPDRQKTVCMKTKLSPATETHPQNNHAFNTGEEPLMITTSSYGGARPKVPLHTPYPTNQTVSDESGVIGVAVSSNVVNGSKLCYGLGNSAQSVVSSQSDMTAKPQTSEMQTMHKSNSAIVGDYFFTNGAFNHSESTEEERAKPLMDDVPSKPVQSFVDRFVRMDQQDDIPRWADPACQGIRYADDDEQNNRELVFEGNIVFDSSQVLTPTSDNQKRLYLEPGSEAETKSGESSDHEKHTDAKCTTRKLSRDLVKERKGSCAGYCNGFGDYINEQDNLPLEPFIAGEDLGVKETAVLISINKQKTSVLSDFERLDITQTASLPNSPLHRLHKPDSPTKKLRDEVIKGKCRHHSPLFKRKSKYARTLDTSEDEDIISSSVEDIKMSSNYKNLESFQKAQLKQKVLNCAHLTLINCLHTV